MIVCGSSDEKQRPIGRFYHTEENCIEFDDDFPLFTRKFPGEKGSLHRAKEWDSSTWFLTQTCNQFIIDFSIIEVFLLINFYKRKRMKVFVQLLALIALGVASSAKVKDLPSCQVYSENVSLFFQNNIIKIKLVTQFYFCDS